MSLACFFRQSHFLSDNNDFVSKLRCRRFSLSRFLSKNQRVASAARRGEDLIG